MTETSITVQHNGKEKRFFLRDGDVSDGYHTFAELYDHRCLLFVNLCLMDAENAYWKPDLPGWFLLYWESPAGQISYHINDKLLSLVDGRIQRDDGHKWDGHTSANVLARLARMALVYL
jgi:hypothetical protein